MQDADILIQESVNYPVVGGRYKHYKGGLYEVIAIGNHSETDEILVIYKSLVFGTTHARPLDIWNKPVNGKIKTDGIIINNPKRFTYIHEK